MKKLICKLFNVEKTSKITKEDAFKKCVELSTKIDTLITQLFFAHPDNNIFKTMKVQNPEIFKLLEIVRNNQGVLHKPDYLLNSSEQRIVEKGIIKKDVEIPSFSKMKILTKRIENWLEELEDCSSDNPITDQSKEIVLQALTIMIKETFNIVFECGMQDFIGEAWLKTHNKIIYSDKTDINYLKILKKEKQQ